MAPKPQTHTDFGFVRVAVISPEHCVADVDFNIRKICEAMSKAASEGAQIALFPELCITGYSCGDLFYQSTLLTAAAKGVQSVLAESQKLGLTVVVGAPLRVASRLYNCAIVASNGKVLGVVPKSFLPNTGEYYEQRWFSSGLDVVQPTVITEWSDAVPFGTDLLFAAENLPACCFGVEICEDLWTPSPPSSKMTLGGATLIANPSASTELLEKANYRRALVKQQSARCLCGYLFAAAGPGESTTDVVFSGHSIVAENGIILAECERFRFDTQMSVVDIDLQLIEHERQRTAGFSSRAPQGSFQVIPFTLSESGKSSSLRRPQLSRTPFVPSELDRRDEHCREVFLIQATALAKRLRHTKIKRAVIGVSGGLDSTLALLVCVKAFEILERSPKDIIAVTMPGFATSDQTANNAKQLLELLQITSREIDITKAVTQHFQDIGHDGKTLDVTYQNAQARERMQILLDLANSSDGIVVGTGDLSELALGWSTFGGDQISMYQVNAGVPKTLVKHLVSWFAGSDLMRELSEGQVKEGEALSAVLLEICETPISPELVPHTKGRSGSSTPAQRTEEIIGPFELQDFVLFYMLRYGFSPSKILFLAERVFETTYKRGEILKWLGVFYQRFFAHQFKRSSMPDGPKVGSVALSPRGDWRMPSDAAADLWLNELSELR